MTAPTGRAARASDDESVARREDLEAWGKAITDRIAQQIVHFRDQKKMSNDALRARLSQLGWDVTRNGLAGLLAGSRKRKAFPVHEILLFAQALNVPPGELIAGATSSGPFPASPTAEEQINPIEAILWIAGQSEAWGVAAFDDDLADDFYDVADLPQMVKELQDAIRDVRTLEQLRRQGLLESTKELVTALLNAQEVYRLTRGRWPNATLPPRLGLPVELMQTPVGEALGEIAKIDLEKPYGAPKNAD